MSNDNGFDNFCEVAGYRSDSLRAVFEFSLYTGFEGINLWSLGYPYTNNPREQETVRVGDKVRAFEGPHGHTMIRAYLAKRRSFTGRLNALWRKPLHVAGFGVVLVACMFRGTWNG